MNSQLAKHLMDLIESKPFIFIKVPKADIWAGIKAEAELVKKRLEDKKTLNEKLNKELPITPKQKEKQSRRLKL